jgi:hypothetical protein
MQIELSDKVQAALEKRATAAGMSVSSYVNLLMEEQLSEDSQAASRRATAIDALLEHVKTSTATSGREGREWREFIHEGHND